MTPGLRRGITRGEVWAYIAAVTLLAYATLVASWGMLSLLLGSDPVHTPGVPVVIPAASLLVAGVLLASACWRVALSLLRGLRAVPVGSMLAAGAGAVLIWWILGTLGGMGLADALWSMYVLTLFALWCLAVLLLWGLLTRRLFTDLRAPQWPWEKRAGNEDVAE